MRWQAMDLVDEQDLARGELGEVGAARSPPLCSMAGAPDGAQRSQPRAISRLMIVGERGLAEAGRAGEQDVVERIAAIAGGGDEDFEVGLRGLLSREIVECRRPQRAVDRLAGLTLWVGDFAVSGHGPAFGILRHAMEQLKNEGQVKAAWDVVVASVFGK